MSDHVLTIVVAVIGALGGLSGLAALVAAILNGRKVRAEAALTSAEARGVNRDGQQKVIDDLTKHSSWLGARVETLSKQVDKLEQREAGREVFLFTLVLWAQKVWAVLTPEQRTLVGAPPAEPSSMHDVAPPAPPANGPTT